MPSVLPDGEPAPADGSLPAGALDGVGKRPFGFYVHVPFCTVRCGYCDFNTYTASELGDVPGASRSTYADAAVAEVRFARRVLGDVDVPVGTVFFGGGTPTLLPPADLARVVRAIDDEFGLADDAEVTTESNPDSVDAAALATMAPRSAGLRSVGVPPPKKIVSIGTSRWPSTWRANRISRIAASAYDERLAPTSSPSSSAV